MSLKEKSPEPSRPSQSSEDCFKSEILRSRGVGSVRRSMMMFMEEQEKAAASKSSAARSVKKMPAFVDYQTDQPSLTGTGVVRVAVPIPQNFVVSRIGDREKIMISSFLGNKDRAKANQNRSNRANLRRW